MTQPPIPSHLHKEMFITWADNGWIVSYVNPEGEREYMVFNILESLIAYLSSKAKFEIPEELERKLTQELARQISESATH